MERGRAQPAADQGDRISTAPDARAELRIGSTVLRLGGGTELEVLRLDDERMALPAAHRQPGAAGALARGRRRDRARHRRGAAAPAAQRPLPPRPHRRHHATPAAGAAACASTTPTASSSTPASASSSGARAPRATCATAGRRCPTTTSPHWVSSEDLRDQRSAAAQYVSPEMTGAEDLDRYGRWDTPPRVRRGLVPLRGAQPAGRRTATAAGSGCGPGAGPGSTRRPGASRRSTTGAGCTGAAAGAGGRAPTWRGRSSRRRWWPGSAARTGACRSISAARPSAGCRWRRARSSCPGIARTPVYVDRINRHPPPPPGRKPVPRVPTRPASCTATRVCRAR